MPQFFGKTFWCAMAVMAVLYLLAFVGFVTSFSWILLIVILGVSAGLAFYRLDYAMYFAFIELFSNPHGLLLRTDVAGFPVSLRMTIFVGIMTGWSLGWLVKKYRPSLEDGRAQLFLFLGAGAVMGFLMGAFVRDLRLVFSDGNAYLYLIYLLPILSVSWTKRHRHDLLQILSAGAVWVSVLSFAIVFVFTHIWVAILGPFYTFLRDLRIAEITELPGGFYRVFIQSQVFTIIFGLCMLMLVGLKQKKTWLIASGAVVIAVILTALSRSFWVGLFPALCLALYWLYRYRQPTKKQVYRFIRGSFLTSVLAIVLLLGVALFPFPKPSVGGSALLSSFRDRTTQGEDVAISSRWNLLTPMLNDIFLSPLVGQGFGSTVTFETDDPRARAINPDGTWTTMSMEWGWFELWLKMGILGPLGFLYAGYELVRRLWAYTKTEQAWLGHALILGLVFLYATHFFSPYLNHPIGLGYLLFLIPFLPTKKPAEAVEAIEFEKVRVKSHLPQSVMTSE